MQTGYLEAVVNGRHRVLGKRLHDLCLFDALFLILSENPLWTGDRTPRPGDLEAAVLICSLPPERFLAAQLAPRTRLERLARAVWQLRCARRCAHHFEDELAAWHAYRADFDSRPQLWEADGAEQGRALKAPWILSLACFLELHTNMREREIMTAPIGLMFWKAQTIAERLGQNLCDMMTDDEIEIGREQKSAMEAEGQPFPEPPDDDDLDYGR